jgi:hypothetical protein
VRPLVALVLLAASAGVSWAKPVPVALGGHGCARQLDLDEIRSILDLELRSNLGDEETTFAVVPASPHDTVEALSVSLDCDQQQGRIALAVERRQPPAHGASLLPLGDVPAQARSRTLALALAEMIRALDVDSPIASTGASTTAATAPRLLLAPPSGPRRRRLRVLCNLALGLAAVGVASVVSGAALSGTDNDRGAHHGPDGDEVAMGFTFGVGGLALVGASVDFGLWMRERAQERAALHAESSAGSLVTVSF